MDISASIFVILYLVFALNSRSIILVRKVEATTNVHIVYMGERPHDDPTLIMDSHHRVLADVVGSRELASKLMVYSYKHGFSGFAAKLTDSQAQRMAEIPSVTQVIPNSFYTLQTTRSWDYLGLSYNAPANLLNDSKMGDGVIIGILDTGIWPESQSFSDEGLGPIPSRWKGSCESGELFDASEDCNKKLIGARWFVDGLLAEYGQPLNTSENREYFSPRDANGHGTHTASTACGSFVRNISYKGLAVGTLRGGAPRARLAVYKVCWNVLGGQCSSADILKAFDEAINDGVDLLSLSLGTSIPLFSNVDERSGIDIGSFHAVRKGVTVVCGAGNEGPAAQTVVNTASWIITVGANTIDRKFTVPIILGNNKTIQGEAIFTGKEIEFTGLVYPEAPGQLDPNSAGVCEALSLNGTSVDGNVVLCFTYLKRVSIMTAVSTVRGAGGVGVIVAKNAGDALSPCSDNFPCIEVDYEIGTQILNYIRSTRSPMVKLELSRTLVGKHISANIAYFSSRGPNSIAPAILKPDVAAPGVNILAATSPLNRVADNGFAMFSGTSMATPHVSGIVALLIALHPDWSPAAIRSSLVTTAWRNDTSGLPLFAEGSPRKLADPFDYGGGIINPNGAADPGLIYDMGMTEYVLYLCALSYNSSSISILTGQPTECPIEQLSILDVNLPSITIPSLSSSTKLTRTVTNVGAPNAVYKAVIDPPLGTEVSVRPAILVFNSTTKSMSFTVTVSPTHQINTGYYFGSLSWMDGVHVVRSPMSVRTQVT